jgi:hypothetical protein
MLRFPTGPRPTRTSHRPRRGAIVPLVCLLLPVLIVLAAFSINFAHMELVRTQAQVAADASVRAAGRTFTLTGIYLNPIQLHSNRSKKPGDQTERHAGKCQSRQLPASV